MRTRVEIKWFAACATMAEVQSLYRKLVMEHHPDRGGDVRKMQEINAEHDELVKNPSRIGVKSRAHSSRWEDEWDRAHDESKRKQRTWEDFRKSSIPEPGRYKVKVTSVRENDEKEYVALIFDICEGRHAGFFAFKPWHRHCVYLSYKSDWQLAKTREIVGKINRSNPGFDGDYAFCNDRSVDFVGKVFTVDLTAQYIRGDGFINDSQVHAT